MGLMTLGSVFVNGGGGIDSVAADMGGDSCAAMEDLHRHRRVARVQLLPHQLEGHATLFKPPGPIGHWTA